MTRRRRVVVNEELSNLQLSYLRCRTLGHAWEDVTGIIDTVSHRELTGDRLVLRCTSCGTIAEDLYSRSTGDRVGTRYYEYPQYYKMVGEEFSGVKGRSMFRLEYVNRKELDG